MLSPPKQPKKKSWRPTLLVLGILGLALLPLIGLKFMLSGRVQQMEDKIEELQEQLLEAEDRVEQLTKELGLEKEAKAQALTELSQMASKLSREGFERREQQVAIAELKAKDDATIGKANAQVLELMTKLKAAVKTSEEDAKRCKTEISKLQKVLADKKEQLESYHKLIVSQKTNLESKTQVINRLNDDLHAQPGFGQHMQKLRNFTDSVQKLHPAAVMGKLKDQVQNKMKGFDSKDIRSQLESRLRQLDGVDLPALFGNKKVNRTRSAAVNSTSLSRRSQAPSSPRNQTKPAAVSP